MMPAASLAGYDEAELWEFYSNADATPAGDQWRAIVAAEIETRAQPAPKPKRAERKDPRQVSREQWHLMAHAQYLAADKVCNGFLVRKPHHDYREDVAKPGKCAEPGCGHAPGYPRHTGVDPFTLWSGSDAFAYNNATDELREFWDANPRVSLTDWQAQAAAEHREWIEHKDRARCAEHVREDATMGVGDMIVRGAVRGAMRSGNGPARPTNADRLRELTARRDAARARKAQREAVRAVMAEDPDLAPSLGAGGGGSGAGTVALRDDNTPSPYDERAAEIIAESLRYAERVLMRHVAWPTPSALDTVLLWLIHANARDRDETGTGPLFWRATPRLLLTSKERGSGKSTGLDLIAILGGSRAGRLSRVTAPGFAKLMAKFQELAVLDEAKMIFGSGQKSLDLQGMLLTGYTRRANSLTAHNGGSLESVFGPVAYAGKDNLITTASDGIQDLLDRSLIIHMRRPARHYPDIDDVAEDAAELAQQGMATWCTMKRGALMAAVKRLNREAAHADTLDSDEVQGGVLRATQLWRPLIACADVIGGDWPERARKAAERDEADTAEWLADLAELESDLFAEPGPAQFTGSDYDDFEDFGEE